MQAMENKNTKMRIHTYQKYWWDNKKKSDYMKIKKEKLNKCWKEI